MPSETTTSQRNPGRPARRAQFVALDSEQPLPEITSHWQSQLSLDDGDNPSRLKQKDAGDSLRISIETSDGTIWIEGNSLFVACPTCTAPLSVRMWLLSASCWQCEEQIQLTREQEKAVEKLLKSRKAPEPKQVAETVPAPPPPEPQPAKRPESPVVPPRNRRRRRAAGEFSSTERVRQLRDRRTTVARIRDTFRMTPAWLISFLLHLIMIVILLMLYLENMGDEVEISITLSTAHSVKDEEGGEITLAKPEQKLDFEAPVPPDADLSDLTVKKTLVKADQDARELRIDDSPTAALPDIQEVKRNLTAKVGTSSRFIARDPRMRVEILKKEGGTSLTEAAVARGLRWLAKVQNSDGSWSLDNYQYYYRENNRGDMAGTALALLPFLGAGQTHEFGKYKSTVARGLKWILDHQDRETGDLRNGLSQQRAMYAHGQAAIVLVEAYAMTGDDQFRIPSQKAIDFIVATQRKGSNRRARGGWRYQPGQMGDTSVFGWQMMALQSALSPKVGLNVPRTTLLYAEDYLNSAGTRPSSGFEAGTFYGYQRNSGRKPAMTAEALLCRIYLGWKRSDSRLAIATDYLLDSAPPHRRESGKYNLYYIYYATQLLHHYGGEKWTRWNSMMQKVLVNSQITEGTFAGSWNPNDFVWGGGGKRIYTTAIAVCTLEVYYRHLPLFKQIDIDADEDE